MMHNSTFLQVLQEYEMKLEKNYHSLKERYGFQLQKKKSYFAYHVSLFIFFVL